METKSPSIIAIGAVVAIVLGLVMAIAGPNSHIGQSWNAAFSNTTTTSQLPAAGTSVVGGPSLSAQKIDTILTNAGSPAAGSGSTFVLDSAQYNIDDAMALAFFHHESSYGTAGAATETHSIGNIVCAGYPTCIGRFRAYGSWDEGIADWYKLIAGPVYAGSGLTTIPQIIPKYAPASDGNSEASYIAAVQADINAWRAS